MTGEATDVHFVHHRPRKRTIGWGVIFPVVCAQVGDHALHRRRCVVSGKACRFSVVASRHGDASAIGVEQYLAAIVAQSVRRIARSVRAIAVNLTFSDARHEGVPVVKRAMAPRGIELDHPRRSRVFGPVEKQ